MYYMYHIDLVYDILILKMIHYSFKKKPIVYN